MPTCYRHPDREAYIKCQRCGRTICPDCMREASVGYQCPNCVAEGARSVRSVQGRFGGSPSANPSLTSYVIIGVNVVLWLAVTVTGGMQSKLFQALALVPNGRCDAPGGEAYFPNIDTAQMCGPVGGSWVDGVATGAPWQLLTTMFAHAEAWHIAGNMISIFFLGPAVEHVLGRARFLAVFFVSGLTASATVLWFANEQGATFGASGAVFGLLAALLVLTIAGRGQVQTLLVWLGLNLFITFAFPGISWQGHIGGFVGGLLATALIVYTPKKGRSPLQWGGLAVLLALVVAAIVVRTVALA